MYYNEFVTTVSYDCIVFLASVAKPCHLYAAPAQDENIYLAPN
jgi:hypothetical protein